MKKLLDAFLELPTWQGIALLVAFCVVECLLLLWIARMAYRNGRFDSDADHLRRFNQVTREKDAIRL